MSQNRGRYHLPPSSFPRPALGNRPNLFRPPKPIRLTETHLLDVIVAQRSSILELLSRKNQSLLVWRDPFFILDLGLNIINGIARLNLEGDSLAGEGLDKAVSC